MHYSETIEEVFRKIEKLLQLEKSGVVKSGEALVEYALGKFNEGKIYEGEPFHKWFFKSIGFYASLLALALSILLITGTISRDTNSKYHFDFLGIQWSLYFIEALALLLVVIAILLRPDLGKHTIQTPPLKRARKAMNALWQYWTWLWIGWLALYIVLGYCQQYPNQMSKAFETALTDFCNNFTGIMFFCLHHELSRKTQDNSQTGSSSRLLILWIIVAFLVFLFEVTSLSSVANENDTIAFDNIVFYFALFSGVVSGIFTLLFICRLESIFFHIPFVWVITLSLYVVIQPMYPFMEAFNDRYPSLSIAIFMVAFWAKLSLLSTVHWARDTDRLLYYMVRRLQIFREEKEGKYREAFVTELGVLPEFNTSKSKPDNTENPGEKN